MGCQDAEARFGELLDACLREGPQLITRRGTDAAVLVPAEQGRCLQHQPTLTELLLASGPRGDLKIPPRGKLRRRPATNL